jgi:sulfite reductase beta subunit-like hemoprotein
MTYLDKLEDERNTLKEREKLWLQLAQEYAYLTRKYQRGMTVNRQNLDDIQILKNKLGIGSGLNAGWGDNGS